MKKHLQPIIILSILFTLYIFICSYKYVSNISNGLSNNVFRLHIIANSDTEEDQNLKYIIRDNLLKYMNQICANATDKEEVIEIASSHINDFKQIAKQTINDNGYSYNVDVEIGNFDFPTKKYGDISFPSGNYDALRVKIGESSGQNWWCVMFPPLCFIDTSTGIVSEDSKTILQSNLSNEEYHIIADSTSPTFSFKFKIIEFFEHTGIITAKK